VEEDDDNSEFNAEIELIRFCLFLVPTAIRSRG
jgi:hypothetical protein